MLSISNFKIVSVYIIALALPGLVVADENENTDNKAVDYLNLNIDKSKWKCKYCPDNEDEPWFIVLEAGLGYVSNDSYKFGEYNGLYEEGGFLILDIDALYRDENANYFDIKTDNLGLETRRIAMEGGNQGSYKINVLVDNINKYNLDTARSPYSGTTNQTLPASWVPGATTGAMTSLSSDLNTIKFSTKRELLMVSSNIIQNKKWNYDVKFKRQTKQGNSPFAVTIGTTFADAKSAVLAKPIDYTTDTFEVFANYNHNNISGSFSFTQSLFKNKNEFVTWENAFTTGASDGKIALEPDNEMQQFMANGQYRGFDDIIVSGLLSVATLKQNESYLPYTNNAGLAPPALPTQSLSGKVNVYNANINVNWTVNKKSKVKLSYEHQEQSNSTARATYSYVIADNALSGTARANLPYSFRNRQFKVATSYKLENNNKITAGVKYGLFNRTYQSVDSAIETSLWTKYAKRLSTDVNYSVKLLNDTRKADGYENLTELSPTENPQLRKYNLADSDGIKIDFNVNFVATEKLFMNINLEHSNKNYSNSTVGLSKGEELSAGIDAQYTMNDEMSFTAYLQQSVISSTQNGSSTASSPDWSAENEDSILSIGLGADYSVIDDELRIGFNYVHTDARSEIKLSGAFAVALPELTSKRDTISLYADYVYDEDMTYKLSYDYEDYKEDNWNLDNVNQGTIDNVVNLGNTSPNYSIGVIWFSMKYLF